MGGAPGRSKIGCKEGQHTPDMPSPLSSLARRAHHLKAHAAAWLLQVFRDCDFSQVEGWVGTLEEQSQITPLWEVFFQLMCHPVPQVPHPALVPPSVLSAITLFILAHCSGSSSQSCYIIRYEMDVRK